MQEVTQRYVVWTTALCHYEGAYVTWVYSFAIGSHKNYVISRYRNLSFIQTEVHSSLLFSIVAHWAKLHIVVQSAFFQVLSLALSLIPQNDMSWDIWMGNSDQYSDWSEGHVLWLCMFSFSLCSLTNAVLCCTAHEKLLLCFYNASFNCGHFHAHNISKFAHKRLPCNYC